MSKFISSPHREGEAQTVRPLRDGIEPERTARRGEDAPRGGDDVDRRIHRLLLDTRTTRARREHPLIAQPRPPEAEREPPRARPLRPPLLLIERRNGDVVVLVHPVV